VKRMVTSVLAAVRPCDGGRAHWRKKNSEHAADFECDFDDHEHVDTIAFYTFNLSASGRLH
jgi:hypothetical protein